uniref:DNA-directed primase/polymerase protein n=1 Tax=Arundo donax TaxID=35708 RepID=A0A0A9D0Q7_ARUDO
MANCFYDLQFVHSRSLYFCRYNDMDPKIRHHYEVIQEGSPCHIYFDLEFDTRLNMNRDADEMVDILVSIIFSALRDKYSIEGHEEWITELDSSTEGLFSNCSSACIRS